MAEGLPGGRRHAGIDHRRGVGPGGRGGVQLDPGRRGVGVVRCAGVGPGVASAPVEVGLRAVGDGEGLSEVSDTAHDLDLVLVVRVARSRAEVARRRGVVG